MNTLIKCGQVVAKLILPKHDGVADLMAGKTLLCLKQRGIVGRSCGFGNGRFGSTWLGDNRFFSGIFQKRVTGYNQTGRIAGRPRRTYYVRMKSYRPSNPNTPAQQAARQKFRDALNGWTLLTAVEKSVYNKRGTRRGLYGRSVYVSEYLKNH